MSAGRIVRREFIAVQVRADHCYARSSGSGMAAFQHKYAAEIADALAKLAALIESIIHPRDDNVVALHPAVAS